MKQERDKVATRTLDDAVAEVNGPGPVPMTRTVHPRQMLPDASIGAKTLLRTFGRRAP